MHGRALLWIAAVAVACGVGCTRPPSGGLADFYARRADWAGLDTSVLQGRTIVIDPGHGGAFAGSRGVGDTREADVNLGVALYLWGLLRDAGADVHLTRASDRDLLPPGSEALGDDLAARVTLLDSLQPDVFLSLHHNSNAALDRERNAIETYYKLDDAGPSYDLARAIHRRLAGVLGTAPGALRPGNYFVLRNANTAAVLGEASYLSHPAVESKLRLAEKQLLEAEAYFLGLIDYFTRGVPRIVVADAARDTLHTGERLTLGIDSAYGVDPLSVQLRVDGRAWPHTYDARTQAVSVHAGIDLPAGPHDFELHARNVRGHAARPWRARLHVFAPPARVHAHVAPDPLPPGGDARVDVRVVDAWARPVADGVRVRFAPYGVQVIHADSTTRAGSARAYVRAAGNRPYVDVQVDSARTRVTLRLHADAPPLRVVSCADAAGTALADVELECGGGVRGRSDAGGAALLPLGCDSLRALRRGYVPWRGARRDTLRLAPALAGHFLGRRIVLDPGGDGHDPTEPGLGISTAELAWQTAAFLDEFLRAAGADVHVTRGPADVVPESERVRSATGHRAAFYVRLEASLDVGRCARVLHYPGSRVGEQLARGLARRLQARGVCDSVRVEADARYVLQQTPCPAIVVQFSGPRDAAARGSAAHPDSLRRDAVRVLDGLRIALHPEIESWPALDVVTQGAPTSADALAVLDGVLALRPDARGHVRFVHVSPGVHHVAWHDGRAGDVFETWIVTGGDDVRVHVPPGAQP